MTSTRRPAIWLVLALAVALAGSLGSASASQRSAAVEAGHPTAAPTAAVHEVTVPARPLADRAPLHMRQDLLPLLLLGWIGAVVASLRSRTLGLPLRVRSLPPGPAVADPRRVDRGPPALVASV